MNRIALLILIAILTSCHPGHAQRTVKREGVKLHLTGIRVMEDTLFFQLTLHNRSLLIYHLRQIRCYTQDRHVPKRTAIQQKEMESIDSLQLHPVPAQSTASFIIPYPAFSVPNSQNLYLLVADTDHSRALRLKLKGRRFRRMIHRY